MIKVVLAAAATLLMTGCASALKPIPLNKQALATDFRDTPVNVVVYIESPVQIYTPGNAVGAGLIDEMTKPDGGRMPMPSPSYFTALKLREQLGKSLGLSINPVPETLSYNKTKRDPAQPASPYTLEVGVHLNFFSYRPMHWQTYQYLMGANAKLLGKDGQPIWQEVCKVGGTASDETLQLDRMEFRANDGKRLKEVMEVAASKCVESMTGKMAGI